MEQKTEFLSAYFLFPNVGETCILSTQKERWPCLEGGRTHGMGCGWTAKHQEPKGEGEAAALSPSTRWASRCIHRPPPEDTPKSEIQKLNWGP